MKISYFSQRWKIIRAIKIHKRLWVAFFQKWSYMVGWKAWTRICELVVEGYLRRSEIDELGEHWQKFATYTLTAKWFNLNIEQPSFSERVKHFFNL
jgi:hypothetical protein